MRAKKAPSSSNTTSGYPVLTLKEIKKRHAQNPQDKQWHEMIEKGVEQNEFEGIIGKVKEQVLKK